MLVHRPRWPLVRTRDDVLRVLLGTADVRELDLPGLLVPRSFALPPNVDPYWTWFGDGAGWSFLPQSEWPREAAWPDRPARVRPPDDPLPGWTDVARSTWPRPTKTREPRGMVLWEVLADLRLFMRLAKTQPAVFFAAPVYTESSFRMPELPARAVGDELSRAGVDALLEKVRSSLGRLEKDVLDWLGAARPERLDNEREEFIRLGSQLEHMIEGVYADALDGAFRSAQLAQMSTVTGLSVPPYPKRAGGQAPTAALVVHAAHHLVSWKRVVRLVNRRAGLERTKETPGVAPDLVHGAARRRSARALNEATKDHEDLARKAEIELLAWIIPAVAALEPSDLRWEPTLLSGGKDTVSYWRNIATNYLRTAAKE